MEPLVHASRCSFGFFVDCGITDVKELASLSLNPKTNDCRSLKFSNNGKFLCYCDSSRTAVIETATGKEIYAMEDLSKTQQIEFSPKDSVLVTYEPYVVYGSRLEQDGTPKKPKPNLNFHSIVQQKHMKVVIVLKRSSWRPQFTDDESKFLRLSDQGIFVYSNFDFENYEKVQIKDLSSFSLSPGHRPHIICFIPGLKGQPALIQLRELSQGLPIKYSKPSFNCDKCEMTWNSKGNAVLITASVDVDKTDKSYYGVSHLYCITTKLDCFQVYLDKQGPLHSVQWSPNSKEFCVCYGFMPSKVTIFNIRGDIVWDIGEGYRNEIHYSPFGDLLATCGFGNISSGKMTFWNIETKKEIIQHEAPLTTYFEWAPDGCHFLTAITAPSLWMDNGYFIWNYGKGVVYHKAFGNEKLWQVTWKPSNSFSKPAILNLTNEEKANFSTRKSNSLKIPLDGLQTSGIVTKSGVYVPPALRKSLLNKPQHNQAPKPQISENEKKQRNLQKKLDDIAKLKEKISSGIKLELNQQEKIRCEDQLRKDLERLKLLSS